MTAIATPHPLIDPLLRTILRIKPALRRYAAQSAECKLHTLLMRETPLAEGFAGELDDSCQVTIAEGRTRLLNHVRLQPLAGRGPYKGIHLALLAEQGSLTIQLGGDDNTLFVGVGSVVRATLQLAGRSTVFIGDECRIAPSRIVAYGADISIGDDCQICEDAHLQAGEATTLFDMTRGERIKADIRSHIKIGRHVQIGRRAMVLDDVSIGEGSVVAAGAVVMGNVGEQCWAAGNPARVIQQHISWSRFPGKPPVLGAGAEPLDA